MCKQSAIGETFCCFYCVCCWSYFEIKICVFLYINFVTKKKCRLTFLQLQLVAISHKTCVFIYQFCNKICNFSSAQISRDFAQQNRATIIAHDCGARSASNLTRAESTLHLLTAQCRLLIFQPPTSRVSFVRQNIFLMHFRWCCCVNRESENGVISKTKSRK